MPNPLQNQQNAAQLAEEALEETEEVAEDEESGESSSSEYDYSSDVYSSDSSYEDPSEAADAKNSTNSAKPQQMTPTMVRRTTYECPACGKRYERAKMYEKHLKTHGLDASAAVTIPAGTAAKPTRGRRVRLDGFIDDDEGVLIEKPRRHRSAGRSYVQKIPNDPQSDLYCAECDRTFERCKPFVNHMVQVHGSTQDYTALLQKYKVQSHTISPAMEVDLPQEQLEQVYKELDGCGGVCPICKRHFEREKCLRYHYLIHKGLVKAKTPADHSNSHKGALQCEICGQTFRKQEALDKHH